MTAANNLPNNDNQYYDMLPTGVYDAHVKRFFTLKVIIAYLLKECVQEYAGFTIEEIIDHLNKEHKDTGSYIAPLNNEFTDVKGRKLNMDIVFHTVVPNTDKLIPVIINLEPQSKYNPGYPLISRGIIYASRLLSLQEQGASIEEFYNNIHKVYSIWICYNVSGPNENTIRCVEFGERVVKGSTKIFNHKDYDLAQVWVISLGDCAAAESGSLLRLLDIAFDKRHNMTKAEKMQVYKEEYNINDNVVAEEVEEMNAYVLDYAASYAEKYAARAVAKARAEEREAAMKLGEARGIAMGEARGVARGEEKKAKETALSMKAKGLSTDFIAECINVDEATVKEWLQATVV